MLAATSPLPALTGTQGVNDEKETEHRLPVDGNPDLLPHTPAQHVTQQNATLPTLWHKQPKGQESSACSPAAASGQTQPSGAVSHRLGAYVLALCANALALCANALALYWPLSTLPKLVRMLLLVGSAKWSKRLVKGPFWVAMAWAP